MPKPSRTAVVLAFASVYVIWGSTYLAIRFGIETIPPFLLAGARNLTAGVLLYAWARARGAAPPVKLHWKSASVIGVLMLLGGNGLVTWSELRVSSGVAALIVACVPLWMVILDGKRPSARTIGGLALGLLGIAILVGPKKLAGGDRVDLVGAGALVLASLSWAIGSLHSKKAPLPESKLLATAMEMGTGGLALLVLGLAMGEGSGFSLAAVSARSVLSLLYLIFLGSLIGFTCYAWLLRVTTPARAATYAYVNPIVALLLGWLIAGEPMSGRTFVAATVIVGGVVMILTRSGAETAKSPKPGERKTSAIGDAEPEGA